MLESLVGQALDRYQLVELLGEGGMGGVFRARDLTLQRDVAIKVMQPQGARLPNFQERFLQEARVAARLDHPGIVKVFDFGQAQGLLYIVMELIRGSDLRQMLDGLQAAGQWISLPEAAGLVRQVCLAVDYAHRQGILHRDIKPGNIMLKPEPAEGLPYRPVLMDLGLAKLLEGVQLTVDGTSLGTPAYMSPEQAMGEKTDARSDVYSLGILLFELAVGRLPFPVQSLTEAIRRHTKEPPPPPRSLRPDLPEALERAILTALEKQPEARFADAGAMAEALAQALPAEPAAAPGATVVGAALAARYEESLARSQAPAPTQAATAAPAGTGRDRISIVDPDGTVRTVPAPAAELTVGRSADNGLVLPYEKVDAHHAKVLFDAAGYKVVDLSSAGGTYLGGARLLPGTPEAWAPDRALRIGACWLRLERTPPATGQASGGAATAQPAPGPARVAAFLLTPELAVDPGASAAAALTVVNQGMLVDHFQVLVAGLPPEWVALPPLIRLLPGLQQQVSLPIQPPRSPASRAGAYPFTIRVVSQDAPGQAAEAQGTLTVNPYSQFRAALEPATVQAGRAARVTIENQGNATQTFDVAWADPAQALAFRPPAAQVTVPEGQRAAAEYRASPRRRRLIGGVGKLPFAARVSLGGAAQAVQGDVLAGGLIPAWLPLVVAILLLALCTLLTATLTRPPAIRSLTVDPPYPLAGQAVTIRWEVQNAQSVELQPFVGGLDPRAGEYTFSGGLPAAQSLTFVAVGRFGRAALPLAIGVVTPTPREEVAPTVSPAAAPTAAASPTPAEAPTEAPAPEPTPTSTPKPCPAVTGPFAAAYGAWQGQLGCLAGAAAETDMALEPFEHGWMFWRKDTREIYALQQTSGGKLWSKYADTWLEGQPASDPALVPPAGLQQPVRGFGRVWREQLGGPSAAIGWARQPEEGYIGHWQQFAGGLLLSGPDGKAYALFAGGRWERK